MSETITVAGTVLTVRPIEVTDIDRLERMFGRLSPESVRFRFFAPIPRIRPSELVRLTDVDHCRHDALVALYRDEIVAVARYTGFADTDESQEHETEERTAELAVTVEDTWQHRGIGRRLSRRLGVLARERGYDTFVARILPDNRAALGLLHDLAPDARVHYGGGDYEARLPLTAPPAATRPRRSAVSRMS